MKQYARFIDILFQQETGAVLWHCETGKDRTGLGTAFLLSLLGVETELSMRLSAHEPVSGKGFPVYAETSADLAGSR